MFSMFAAQFQARSLTTTTLSLSLLTSVFLFHGGQDLHAQTTIDAYSSESYSSPSAALTAATSLDTYAPWTGVTVNGIHPVSVTVPGYTGGTYLTWMVDRSAFNSDSCTVASADVPAPVYWTGTDSCGGGLGAVTVHTESTFPLMAAWIAANLDAQQQETMSYHAATGIQRSNVRHWVTYQIHQVFCSIH